MVFIARLNIAIAGGTLCSENDTFPVFNSLLLDICSLDHLRPYKPFDLAICSWPSRRDLSVLQAESLCKGLKSATVEGRYVVFLHHVWCAEFGEDFANFWDNILAEVDFTVSTTGYLE